MIVDKTAEVMHTQVDPASMLAMLMDHMQVLVDRLEVWYYCEEDQLG